MARFKFRLATLLKLREATRDERRTELGTSLSGRRRAARTYGTGPNRVEHTAGTVPQGRRTGHDRYRSADRSPALRNHLESSTAPLERTTGETGRRNRTPASGFAGRQSGSARFGKIARAPDSNNTNRKKAAWISNVWMKWPGSRPWQRRKSYDQKATRRRMDVVRVRLRRHDHFPSNYYYFI